MSWQETIKGQKKLFVRNKTLNDKEVLLDNTPALSEEQKLRDEEKERRLKFILAAEEKVKPGQQQLAKEDDCITDNDLRIDIFQEMVDNLKLLISLVKQSDSSPDKSFRVQIAEAYNTLMGTYKEIHEDMLCFKNQLDNE